MNKRKCIVYLFWIGLTEFVGIMTGLLTRQGMIIYSATATKPPLTPPSILFPIVWTILYAFMGISIARIRLKEEHNEKAFRIYFIQLSINVLWSFVFFNFHAYGLAFYVLILLWLLIYTMILVFKKYDEIAAYLQISYLIWVSFAGYLNYMIWLIN